MRSKYSGGWVVLVTILLACCLALLQWYHNALQFSFAEKAVLSGQRVTIAIDREQLSAAIEQSPANRSHAITPEKAAKPAIAILLTELGTDAVVTKEALALPDAVALGFSPYIPALKEWIHVAKNHPVFLSIPIREKAGTPDTQPYDLHASLSEQENTTRLTHILSAASNYAGVYTRADAKMLLSLKNIRPFLDSVKARNLLFVYSNGESDALQQLAAAVSLPIAEGSIIIDTGNTETVLQEQLAALETKAKETGHVLAIVNASPAMVQVLRKWLPLLESKGFKIIPVADIVKVLDE